MLQSAPPISWTRTFPVEAAFMYAASPVLSFIEEHINTALLITWALRIAGVVTVWIAVWILVRYLSRWIVRFDQSNDHFDISRRDLRTIDRLLDYVVIVIGIIITLAIMGWTNLLVSALTAAGVFTIIVGFAVKDVAANFISGIFILIDRPFVPGDFIELTEFSGTVQNVSLRTTTLITLDGPVVFIPNSKVAMEPTINYSMAKDRRINFTVSIAQENDISQAIQIITGVLQAQAGVLSDRTQLALVSDLREYAVDISVTCYAKTDDFLTQASQVRQQVMAALKDNSVELAVPVRKNLYPATHFSEARDTTAD
jgi:small conductance mechanosensitive channel